MTNYLVCSKCGDEFKTEKLRGWCDQCLYEAEHITKAVQS